MNARNSRLIGESVFRVTPKPKAHTGWFNPLSIIAVLGVAALMSRAFFLQVSMGASHELLAEGNSLTTRRVVAQRGVITDRTGEVLARNTLNKDGKIIRDYPQAENTAHIVGYLGAVTATELEACSANKDCPLTGEDVTGKLGVERTLDSTLRGANGEELLEVDARGRDIRQLNTQAPQSGPTVKLNIDSALQRFINSKLADREKEKGKFAGSVVVSRTQDGRILSMVSWPGFDPNDSLVPVLADTTWNPMFMRPISGVYAPGSVFKLVTAVAGLETGAINPDTQLEDTGVLKVGDYSFGNWLFEEHGRTEGLIDVKKALGRSNDIFFYQVGEKVGVNALHDWAQKLGLGNKTGVDLPGEVAGRVPEPIWKERTTGERWFLGNTYHMSIGQGDLQVSPLQINRMTSAVITDQLCTPKVVDDGKIACTGVGLKPQTRQVILDGMIEACSPGGTAFPFFEFTPQVACKTGTAQTGSDKTKPHAWISVIVPQGDGGKIENYMQGVTITVMLEESGEGSYEAGPVAHDIAQYLIDHKF